MDFGYCESFNISIIFLLIALPNKFFLDLINNLFDFAYHILFVNFNLIILCGLIGLHLICFI